MRWNAVAVLHYKNLKINTCQLHAYWYFPRWRLPEHEFRTQYSACFNSNGPSPLDSQIQMSAVWGKMCGQIPQRGDSRSVQMPHLCPYPPLRLNIDTCITDPYWVPQWVAPWSFADCCPTLSFSGLCFLWYGCFGASITNWCYEFEKEVTNTQTCEQSVSLLLLCVCSKRHMKLAKLTSLVSNI